MKKVSDSSLPPVVLIAFQRAGLLRQVLDALCNQRLAPSEILIYLDAPRDEQEALKVKECRELIRLYTVLPITVYQRERNLGCAGNVLQSVTEVLRLYPAAVILEDDLVPAPAFYETMCRLLDRYRSVPSVFSVSGYSPKFFNHIGAPQSEIREDFFVSNSFVCWGWATWADRWNGIAEQILNGEIPYKSILDLPLYEHLPHLPHVYHNRRKGRNDEWFHLVTYHCFRGDWLTVCSKKSLIYNAGCGHPDAANMHNEPNAAETSINHHYDETFNPQTFPQDIQVHRVLTGRHLGRKKWEYFLNEFLYQVFLSWFEKLIGKEAFSMLKNHHARVRTKKIYYWLITFPKRALASVVAVILVRIKSS